MFKKYLTYKKMKPCWITCVVLIVVFSLIVDGRRYTLLPMSGREVYKVLKEAGRADAIPQGRFVTQGLSAAAGFALGLTSGIGGATLFDLLTSNATQQMFSNYQGINITSLMGLFSGGGSTNANGVQTQEICFNSRSLNDISEEEDGVSSEIADYDEEDVAPQGRQNPTNTVTSTVNTSPTTTTTISNPTISQTTSPSNTGTVTNTGTNINTGTGTGTATGTTTETGATAINCVVIEKPSLG